MEIYYDNELKIHSQSDTEILSEDSENPLERTLYDLKIDNIDDNVDEGYIPEEKGEHPFLTICRKLHEKINGHPIDELRKYMNSNGMRFSVMQIHEKYKQEILHMDNENLVKQEIDILLEYLGISYYDMSISENI